jgi:hypothetical protein
MRNDMTPIFFAWTRSFWATVAGLGLVLFDAPPEVLRSIGDTLHTVWPAMIGSGAGDFLVKAAPAALWAFALQQRSGAARPYTVDPKALK